MTHQPGVYSPLTALFLVCWGTNNPSLPPIIKRYVPKKKASIQSYFNSFIQSYFIFLRAYVQKLERNYIDKWGSGGYRPQKPATFQRIR